MGICMPSRKIVPSDTVKANFDVKYLLGRGGFGEVWKVIAK